MEVVDENVNNTMESWWCIAATVASLFQREIVPLILLEILKFFLTILGKSLKFCNKRPNLPLDEIAALLKQLTVLLLTSEGRTVSSDVKSMYFAFHVRAQYKISTVLKSHI